MGSAPAKRLKQPDITTSERYPNQNSPMDSGEEARFFATHRRAPSRKHPLPGPGRSEKILDRDGGVSGPAGVGEQMKVHIGIHPVGIGRALRIHVRLGATPQLVAFAPADDHGPFLDFHQVVPGIPVARRPGV